MSIKPMESTVIAKCPESLYDWLGELSEKLLVSRGRLIRDSLNFYLRHLKEQEKTMIEDSGSRYEDFDYDKK